MKKSIITFVIIIVMFMVFSACYLMQKINHNNVPSLDVVAVNDIKQSVIENWNTLNISADKKHGLDFTVLDMQNNIVAKTSENLNSDINSAISHCDTIVDIYNDNEYLGKLIIYNDYDDNLHENRKSLYLTCFTLISVFLFICIIFAVYIYISVFKPFNKLQLFAKNVAMGNLDVPLEMDKQNVFGAFTESFDIMRDELKSARLAEQVANKSKKELVAQLSHDIKTPVASIKVVSELLTAKVQNGKEITVNDIQHFDTIGKKSDQINTLITNMFNATLEELQELKVDVSEQSSQNITDIICTTDYFSKVQAIDIPECLIYADLNRLTQVIDNIISNSYKYANTDIELKSSFDDDFLLIEFLDFGNGVSEDELPLLFNKFYRAKNSDGKSGTGLGLYISRYLMNKMHGEIMCENTQNGFKITIMLKLI